MLVQCVAWKHSVLSISVSLIRALALMGSAIYVSAGLHNTTKSHTRVSDGGNASGHTGRLAVGERVIELNAVKFQIQVTQWGM